MAKPQAPKPAVQLVAIFSRHAAAMDWARERCCLLWGNIALQSPRFDHRETSYYADEMGRDLWKQFLIMEGTYDPARLAQSKLQSNALEDELAASRRHPEPRPVNIDPGYIQLTKLVLASAKDRAHRIYLSDGIYAEECLYYLDGRWQARPWTYPDYQRHDFQEFFVEAREYLKRHVAR